MNRRKFVGILAALPGLKFLKLDLKLKPETQGTLPPPIGWPPERCEFVYDGQQSAIFLHRHGVYALNFDGTYERISRHIDLGIEYDLQIGINESWKGLK